MVTAAVAMPEATVGIVVMTNDEARACVSRIKAAAEDICALLCDLHEREGWRALGYKTWGECIKHEFQMSRQHAHRLVNSHIVQRVLTPVLAEKMSPAGDIPKVPETHARQLAPLIDQPETLQAAYVDAIEATGGNPTEEAVHDAVDRQLGRPSKPLRPDRQPREKRSVSSGAERADFQDAPADDGALGFEDAPAEAQSVSNEPQRGPQRTQWCQDCGDRYSGETCACKSADVADEPVQPAGRTGSKSGHTHPATARTTFSGPPPLTIQGDAGDAMRALADRYALDRVAEGIGEAYSHAERGSLTAQLLDSLTDAEKARIAHRANVAVKSQPATAPTLVQVAEMGEALTVGEQLGVTSRWIKAWPVTDLERLATFLPHLIERKRRESAGAPLATAV